MQNYLRIEKQRVSFPAKTAHDAEVANALKHKRTQMNSYVKTSPFYSMQLLCVADSDVFIPAQKAGFYYCRYSH